jgi:acetyltransferase-like isoleucine patch superfamily enzyme
MKTVLQLVGVLPFFLLAAVTAGLAIAPGILVFQKLSRIIVDWGPATYYPALGATLVLSYITYGLFLILIAPLFNLLLGGRLSAWRGPQVSPGALRWYVHATLTLLPRLTFLEFLSATPYLNVFYMLMGMKIGEGVTINTTAIADPSLIELGDRVTLGGSCNLMAHYAQGGYLVIAPVKIGAGATIGLRAIIMGGVTVGSKAKVLAGSFVMPKTVIPDGETWGGIPAVRIDMQEVPVEVKRP